MNKLKMWFYNFMRGRYGADTLYWWSFGAIIVLWFIRLVLSFFRLHFIANILNMLSTIILVFAVFRFFSRNTYKRSAENRAFCRFIGKFKGTFTLLRNKYRDRNTHVYKKCPKCKAVLRLPKRSGEHTAKCPKCSERFTVKIR